jgi:hypothetical protein
MTEKSDASFAIVRFNQRTYQSGGVVAVVKGAKAAEKTLKDFFLCQNEEDQRAGWSYFLEQTNLRRGMDLERATELRQAQLDLQESLAKRPGDRSRTSL